MVFLLSFLSWWLSLDFINIQSFHGFSLAQHLVAEKGKKGVGQKNAYKSNIFVEMPFVARQIHDNSAIVGKDGAR